MRIAITKLVASGNDFVLLDARAYAPKIQLNTLAKNICNRKFGIGADGLLVLEKSKKATFKMRIFNTDGSEAEMCGNGARCAAYYIRQQKAAAKGEPRQRRESRKQILIETKAGMLTAQIDKDQVAINMTRPKDIKLDILLMLNRRKVKANFINSGVPHVVLLSEGLEDFDVFSLGRPIRYHKRFQPKGTNVNFIEPISTNRIKIRTYERGVEQETLACGTGAVASSIIYFLKLRENKLIKDLKSFKFFVQTRSGETLEVNFDVHNKTIDNVWLKGKARIICEGVYYV